MDMKGLLQSATRKDFLRYQIWLTEKANQEMRLESARCGVINTYMTFVSYYKEPSVRSFMKHIVDVYYVNDI